MGRQHSHLLHAVARHRFQQHHARHEIVVVVREGRCHRLPHGLEAGEVNDSIEDLSCKEGGDRLPVTQVGLSV